LESLAPGTLDREIFDEGCPDRPVSITPIRQRASQDSEFICGRDVGRRPWLSSGPTTIGPGERRRGCYGNVTVKGGDIERVTRGVYRLTRYPISPLGQYMEAALWPQVRRPDARGVISHESALAIYGLSDASPAKVHLTLPTALRIRRAVPKRLALHYADLEPKDLHQVEGVPVTAAARAIRDAHASHLGPALIRQAINDGRRTGHLTLDEAEQLEHELLGTNPRRRTRRTKSVRGDAA
jgi:hypothetical protein